MRTTLLLAGLLGITATAAPPRAPRVVTVEAFDFRFDLWGEAYDEIRNTPASSTGAYSYDFDHAGVDIKGGAQVVVSWRNGSDTVRVGRFQIAPFVVMAIGSSELVSAIGPNQHLKVTLGD